MWFLLGILDTAVAATIIISTVIWLIGPRKFPASKVAGDGIKRRLNSFETVMSLAHDGGNLILSNILHIRSNRKLSLTDVQTALHPLATRHPLLRARIATPRGPKGPRWFEPVPDFTVHLTQSDRTDWQAVIEEELLTKFDTRTALWRVIFLPNAQYETGTPDPDYLHFPYQSACVFVFHHAITDGPSYIRLFDEFLNNLHNAVTQVPPVVREKYTLLPPFSYFFPSLLHPGMTSRLLRKILPVVFRIRFLQSIVIGKMQKPSPYVLKHQEYISNMESEPRRTRVLPMEFSREETSLLLKGCKNKGATIQGAIQAATSVAIATMLQDGDLKEELELTENCTANLRPLIPNQVVPNEYCGAYFAGIPLVVTIKPVHATGAFWDLAKYISTTLHQQINDGTMLNFLKKLEIYSPLVKLLFSREDLTKKNCGRNAVSLVYTNLGNCSFLNRSDISSVKLRARYGCSAEHNMGGISANNLATFEGRLFWTFVYYEPVTSSDWMQEYSSIVKRILMESVQET